MTKNRVIVLDPVKNSLDKITKKVIILVKQEKKNQKDLSDIIKFFNDLKSQIIDERRRNELDRIQQGYQHNERIIEEVKPIG